MIEIGPLTSHHSDDRTRKVKISDRGEERINSYFRNRRKGRTSRNGNIDSARIKSKEKHDYNVPSETNSSNCSCSTQVGVLDASSSPQNRCKHKVNCDGSSDYVNVQSDSSLSTLSSSSSSPSLSHCSQESNLTSILNVEYIHEPLSSVKSHPGEALETLKAESGNGRARKSSPALITPANLGLSVHTKKWIMPSSFGSPFSTPRELRVNYLEARFHPHHIQRIPWEWMINERYRLTSFVRFPSDSPISTIQLASKGFVYFECQSSCSIICVFCITRLQIFDNMEYVDAEHKRLGMDCPIVRGTQSSNISMKQQCPDMNVEDIFTLLHATGQIENQIQEPVATPVSPNGNSDNVRSSQPSDETGSSVIVTNTSDLAESDSAAHNSGQSVPSSQVMEDSVSSPGQVESEATSEIPNDAQLNPATSGNNAVEDVPNTPQSNSQQGQTNDSTEDTTGEATSYEKLGIITARPKRVEYAVYATRFNSFNDWPRNHHIKPVDLAKAGYFFTGYSDCARCFYCGGGLRNWEPEDDVWVEHARWFPRCAFLLQEVGKDFIDTVQALSRDGDQVHIKYDDVISKMQSADASIPLKFRDRVIERDPAVLSVIDNGFDKAQLIKLAQEIRKAGELLSSDKLYEAANSRKLPKQDCSNNLGSDSVSIRRGGDERRDKEMIETLRGENGELRQQTTCKICMDMEVAVVFLPCGHLVSCTECSCALTTCPVCRLGIKGIVRAYIG